MKSQPPPTPPRLNLNRAEKFAFARHAALAQLRELPGQLKVVLRANNPHSALAIPDNPPDSAFTRRAIEFATDVYGPELLRHCLRCWYFGDLFAQREHRRYDPELFYIACLLHDIALTGHHGPGPADAPCFAVHGGDLAASALREWGADTDFCETVREAIAAHLDVTAPSEHGVEAYLLHAAARLDVVGARVSQLPGHLLRHVHTLHPRVRFASTVSRALSTEARRRPDSRIAVLWKIGMKIPIVINPITLAR